jgi:hypothetical protein
MSGVVVAGNRKVEILIFSGSEAYRPPGGDPW